MKRYYFLLFLLLIVLGISCNNNPYERDVSSVEVTVEILDFEDDILDLAHNFSEAKRVAMLKKYPVFFETFNEWILHIGVSTDSTYVAQLAEYMNSEGMEAMYEQTIPLRERREELQQKLHSAFQYYLYYFPEKHIPQVCTFVGNGTGIAVDSSVVGIGLDSYLGADAPIYKDMGIANFTRQKMYFERIPVDFMRALAEYNDFPKQFGDSFFEEDHLLAHMIGHGRLMFFVKSMLPAEPDTVIWGYTKQQLEFCEQSEREFWKYFVSNSTQLFGSNYMDIKRFTEDGPFTHVFTRESPGRLGQWIGFRIVESFMKHNPDVTMHDLFAITSAQEIVQRAKYNP
ncbi:MAG: hypothetical protein LBM68_01050 [Bacteroidales bacterium]|jgi:hypothetical protein|nr:hypothetical protein [Bacteroidales bacterium]